MKAIVKSKGLKKPAIVANIQASLDLKKLDQAFGFENMSLKGLLKLTYIMEEYLLIIKVKRNGKS